MLPAPMDFTQNSHRQACHSETCYRLYPIQHQQNQWLSDSPGAPNSDHTAEKEVVLEILVMGRGDLKLK